MQEIVLMCLILSQHPVTVLNTLEIPYEFRIRETVPVLSFHCRGCVDGQVLKGSPFPIGVSPGTADPAKCSAVVEAVGSSERSLEAGKELVVAVCLRDSFKNVTNSTGEPLIHTLLNIHLLIHSGNSRILSWDALSQKVCAPSCAPCNHSVLFLRPNMSMMAV